MKKFYENGNWLDSILKKILLVMKLTTVIIFISIMHVSATVYSQATKLSLNMQETTIKEVLQKIESLSEFRFIYQNEEVDLDIKVNVQFKDERVENILNGIFEGEEIEYLITSNNLILIKSRENQEYRNVLDNGDIKQKTISGKVTDSNEQPLPGVTVVIKGTTQGTITDTDGNYFLPDVSSDATLSFSFVGMKTQEVIIGSKTSIDIILQEEIIGMEEVVVVGYGTQKKSDITGSVASISQERLENIPSQNIAQLIQGTVPGVMIQTTSAGAEPSESFMIRGRNSITASNNPLIVVDGITYDGQISDINPHDIQSIEILKDASSAAIYGSRGSNGVILITSKSGEKGKLKLSYKGNYGIHTPTNLLDHMSGEEFYAFKMERAPEYMTSSEQAIYDSGEWVEWYDLIMRNGFSQDHNVSVSGGTENTKFYISGGLLDVKGITVNDKYIRAISRVNVETEVTPWLTLGTKTQFSYVDRSGYSPSWSSAYGTNPLVKAYDDENNITIYPWEGMPNYGNPLENLLYDDSDESYQIITNNFGILKFPFIKGLEYRINAGFNFSFGDKAFYAGRDTRTGLEIDGYAETSRDRYNSTVIENVISYNREFEKHNIFITALYSFEGNKNTTNSLISSGFENDVLTYYAASQADYILPSYGITESYLISQMFRCNYAYDNRYLITLTGRRDGFSGFGDDTKWGIFPSFALGWNIHNENFFDGNNFFTQLKLRASYGINGNQAVGSYQSITRLEEYNYVESDETAPGYIPSILGDSNLGWESSATLNLGLDFVILNNKISGDINLYKTTTTDLLLDRTISSVHGISSITTNIGEVLNKGIELSINSRNISTPSYGWTTSVNFAYCQNKIVSLYGLFDENGKEIDDTANNWFIGKSITSNYDFDVIGVWQLDEAEEAAKWESEPGNVKIDDVNGDYTLDDDDLKFLGQQDPKFMWGMTNSFFYKDFGLNIFIHGVHGVTLNNTIMHDHVLEDVRYNTMKKNWWTEENPTNEWYANRLGADVMGGILARKRIYQNASFIRIKDVTLSYDLSKMNLLGLNNLKISLTGRNLFTFTEWTGLDPEISDQKDIPLQRELILGIDMSF